LILFDLFYSWFDKLTTNGINQRFFKGSLNADRLKAYRQDLGCVHLPDHLEHEILEGEDGWKAMGHFLDLDAGRAENHCRLLARLHVDFHGQRGQGDFRSRQGRRGAFLGIRLAMDAG
jgi:hypothetical protein